jgi:vacuolar-type H+-ATPase subunit H
MEKSNVYHSARKLVIQCLGARGDRKGSEMSMVEKSTELSEDVLEEVKKGQQAAIEAVRKFTETVDKTLAKGEDRSQAEEIVDSALEMADRLVETQYNFLRKVVRSSGESLGASGGAKKGSSD